MSLRPSSDWCLLMLEVVLVVAVAVLLDYEARAPSPSPMPSPPSRRRSLRGQTVGVDYHLDFVSSSLLPMLSLPLPGLPLLSV